MQARPAQFSLICDFCSSDRDFAIDFFQIPPHDGHPCHSLTVRHYQALYGTFTHKLLPMLGTHLKKSSQNLTTLLQMISPLNLAIDFTFLLVTFLAYLWADEVEAKAFNKKSIDDGLKWLWKKV